MCTFPGRPIIPFVLGNSSFKEALSSDFFCERTHRRNRVFSKCCNFSNVESWRQNPTLKTPRLSEEKILSRWEGDTAAWSMAKAKATEISQLLLAWLLSAEHQPVPSMRLDFMVKRLSPGKARVIFGEYCHLGL